MRILVTGSSGFIGTYLVQALKDEGHHVVGLDRESPGWCKPDEFVHGDILDDGTLDHVLRGVDCVFHLAAAKDDWGLSSEEYRRDNVRATEELLRAGSAQQVPRWFHFSTVGVLRRGRTPLDEDAPLEPETEYGASKVEAEKLMHRFSRIHPDTGVMILRPSAVFGPRNPATTNVHRLIEAIRARRFMMVGDGDTPKTTSYIENLLAATLFLLDEIRPGLRLYHYVDKPVMTTDHLVDLIYRFVSKDRPGWRIPLPVARSAASISDFAGSILDVDFPITGARIQKFCTPTNFSAAAIRSLGYEQPVTNEEAVRRTVAWHLEHSEH